MRHIQPSKCFNNINMCLMGASMLLMVAPGSIIATRVRAGMVVVVALKSPFNILDTPYSTVNILDKTIK